MSCSLILACDYRTCFVLPKKTEEGYSVLYQKVESSDVSKYNFDDSCKLFFMTMDVLLQTEGTTPGIIFLLDYTNIRFSHLTKASIASIRKMFQYVQVQYMVTGLVIRVLTRLYVKRSGGLLLGSIVCHFVHVFVCNAFTAVRSSLLETWHKGTVGVGLDRSAGRRPLRTEKNM